jgi:tetratricopeptide (TPR) repeat protein
VMDNFDKPSAVCVGGDVVAEYRSWIRPGGRGLLLVTSRDRDSKTWGNRADLIELGPLDTTDAATVLNDAAPEAADKDVAAELANRLGGLPLALQAAAATIAAPTGRYRTFAAYTAALASRATRLLAARPDVADPDVARQLIGYTWELSLDQLDDEGHPSARPLMRLLALCAEAPIPRTLIGPELFNPMVCADAKITGEVSASVLDGAVAGLHRYCLVDAPDPLTTGGVSTVALHPVVREATTELLTMAVADVDAWRSAVTDAMRTLIAQIAEADRAGWETARLISPHALLLADLNNEDTSTFEDARHILQQLADVLDNAGAHRILILLRRTMLSAETRRLGPDHPQTLASRSNLAITLGELGDYRDAVELQEQVVADSERILGHDHPDTLSSRGDLAISLGRVGEYGRAAELQLEVLVESERALGHDHPDTLTSRGNLAITLGQLGAYGRAAELQEQVLADSERILGHDHPDTLTSRSNYATALDRAGEHNLAVELQERVVADSELNLGADHPDTLTRRGNLAAALGRAGEHDRAVEVQEQVVADSERILGPGHPYTRASRRNLSDARRAAQRI